MDIPKPIHIDGRRVGNTTRLIDSFVQQLFTTGSVIVYDHHTSDHAWKIMIGRLEREHYDVMKHLELNKVRRTIKFKQQRYANTQI